MSGGVFQKHFVLRSSFESCECTGVLFFYLTLLRNFVINYFHDSQVIDLNDVIVVCHSSLAGIYVLLDSNEIRLFENQTQVHFRFLSNMRHFLDYFSLHFQKWEMELRKKFRFQQHPAQISRDISAHF